MGRTAGRPRYRPSKKDRRIVRYLASYGLPQIQIALIVGRTVDTITKYYSFELKLAEAEKIIRVAEVAYLMAVNGKYPSMTMFYLKTRAQWRETDKPGRDVESIDDRARQIRDTLKQMDTIELADDDFKRLTDERLSTTRMYR